MKLDVLAKRNGLWVMLSWAPVGSINTLQD